MDATPTPKPKFDRTQTISYRILEMISKTGGMRFSDIQREICKMNGHDYDRKTLQPHWVKTGAIKMDGLPEWIRVQKLKRTMRGYWCTNLLGSGFHGHGGLLNTFCTKGNDGLWRYAKSFLPLTPWAYVPGKGKLA